jgi:VWFA-related protein
MLKTLLFASLIFFAQIIFGQVENSKTDFSESIPYKPRKIEPENKKKVKTENETKEVSKLVYVPVFVYDKNNKPVQNLNKEEFKLLIDDNEKDIFLFESEEKAFNVRLIFDTSNSTRYSPKEIKNFANLLLKNLNSQSKIQIITFDTELRILNELTNNREVIDKAINKIKFGGGTSLYDSIGSLFMQTSDRSDVNLVLLLTDGVDTVSRKISYHKSLRNVEQSNSIFYTFFINNIDLLDKKKPSKSKPKPINQNSVVGQILGGIAGSQGVYINNSPPFDIKTFETGLNYVTDIVWLSGGKLFEIQDLAKVNQSDFDYLKDILSPHYFLIFNTTENDIKVESQQIKVRINRPDLVVKARGSFVIQD